ncbi:MAG: hypothetical protein L0191_21775, partial [Acidobacteria bacterium]|nr:hypothetical protein [Acidobacteriota bacterium]
MKRRDGRGPGELRPLSITPHYLPHAEGSVRDGLSILDQAIAMGRGHVAAGAVRSMLGLADRARVFDL